MKYGFQMRYIIEASLLHAHLFNRTLVLPSFVYARACEHDMYVVEGYTYLPVHVVTDLSFSTVCAAFATMVNRGDAVGLDEWRHLPIETQM